MTPESTAHLGILDVFDALHRPFAVAMGRLPVPRAPGPDDEVDPDSPAIPVGQQDEE